MKMVDVDNEVNEVVVEPQAVQAVVEPVAPIVKTDIDEWEITDLPSNMLLYPEGTKIYGRRLKVKEVKKLAQMNSENTEEIIQDVLRSAIKGIDVDELFESDKLYIILWLRANTYREPNYNVSYYCTKCNSISDYNFQLSNLKINMLKEKHNLNFKLTNGDSITRKYLQVKDVNRMDKFKLTHSNIEIDDEILEQAVCMELINDENYDLMNKYLYIEKLDAPNFVQLTTYFEKYDFGIGRNIDVTCNKCKGESSTGLIFRKEFFIPKYSV